MVKPKPDDFPTVTPYLYYEDLNAAFDWLVKAFGFREKFRMPDGDGKLVHAELNVGADGVVMIGTPGPDYRAPREGNPYAQLYIYVDDVDAHFARARDAGAKITEQPTDVFYGDRRYMAQDPEGQVWCFATHVKDLTPEEMAQAAPA
jgi:uncharacterized glyoxalase superfamily protein PhnB